VSLPPRARTWPGRVALLGAALLLGLSGCAAPGTDFEALPFYREDRTHPEGVVRVTVPPALFLMDTMQAVPDHDPEAPPETHTFARFPWPLLTYIRRGTWINLTIQGLIPSEGGGLSGAGPLGRAVSADADVRMDPLANFASDPASGGLGTLPFFAWHTEVDHNAIPDSGEGASKDHDTGFLPFFMYGSGDDPEDEYFVVFPLGGTTKGLLGKEEITWYGFPFSAYMHIKDRAYESHHVMFPFVNWLEGPQNKGFRIFPFYGNYERWDLEGDQVYERSWALWPFVTWGQDGMNEEEGPTDILFALPFYGRIDGPSFDSWTVLWPFFKYEEDTEAESWELRAPFPFLQIAGSESGERWKFDMWPLFGVKERPGFHRNFAVWPIWHYEDIDEDHVSFRGRWAMPFYWSTSWYYPDEGIEEHRLRLFPLVRYRALRDGSVELAVPGPYWYDTPTGFERVIEPFMRLYRYTKDPTGGVEHQALMGLFSYRDLPEVEGREAYTRLSLLFGLLHFRKKGEEYGLRLLWLPEITWGGRDPDP
jgi:hypothetical protein